MHHASETTLWALPELGKDSLAKHSTAELLINKGC